MAGSVSDNFISLLRTELCGEGADELCDKLHALSGGELSEITSLAKKHDLLPVAAHAIASHCTVKPDTVKKLNAVYLKSVGVCEKQIFEISSIASALEKAGVSFIFLKGAVMRGLYPEKWMRTSSDVDILVQENDLEKASRVLVDSLGYTCAEKGTHDVQLSAPSGIHVELHFRLIEEYRYPRANEYLDSVREYSRPKNDGSFEHVLTDEMFIFYHIAHMVKHFEGGGCGVRFFSDLYFIGKRFGEPSPALRDMLTKAGFMKFYETSALLASRWFDGIEAPELDEFADFIISLGTFGSRENRVAVRQSKSGGRSKYLLRRIFMPYDLLTVNYPSLKGKKHLTPVYEVRRWWDIMAGGRGKKAGKEFRTSIGSDASGREKMSRLMTLTGLK